MGGPAKLTVRDGRESEAGTDCWTTDEQTELKNWIADFAGGGGLATVRREEGRGAVQGVHGRVLHARGDAHPPERLPERRQSVDPGGVD